MIVFQNEKRRVVFQEGDPKPLNIDKPRGDEAPGITVRPIKAINEILVDASRSAQVRAPQITYGVDYCDLNCPYCVPAESLMTMSDTSLKEAKDVKIGDELMGFVSAPLNKRNFDNRWVYAKSTVTNVNVRIAEVFEVTLENGETIRCTEDHQWFSPARRKQPYSPLRKVKRLTRAAYAVVGVPVHRAQRPRMDRQRGGEYAITDIRSVGPQPVYSFTTSTGNYITQGYLSKNCLNEYENSTGEFALSKYGSQLESLTRLCEWIAESSEFSLGWAVGEPLSKPGLAFIERFQHALTENAREKCYNVGLHTNGTYLAGSPFPAHLYEGFRRRSVYWTISLLSENDQSHRSIEKHFDFLMDCARNYRAEGWFRGIRVVLPTEISLSDLPDELIQNAFCFLEEAQPDTVEPFYLVRLERSDADVHHHVFNPNCRDFLWRLSRESKVLSHMSPRQHSLLIEKKTISLYDKIIQTTKPTEFLLSDLDRTVNTNDLPKVPYREYATKNLEELMAGTVNPLCLECAGLPYCTVFQRPDLHYTMGWGRTAHRQYEDTLLNMMYLYGLIYLDRLTKGTDCPFYHGQPLTKNKETVFFPTTLEAIESIMADHYPEDIITKTPEGIFINGNLAAMRLEDANLNFPGYVVDGAPKTFSSITYINLVKTPA